MKITVGLTLSLAVVTAFILGVSLLVNSTPANGAASEGAVNSIYDIDVKDIKGNTFKLDRYKGQVMLIVNVASQCGYTPQYAGLQKLYETYQSQGLVVLGFPANNFGGQEPGTEAEIVEFCSMKYNVKFPMFSKISAAGADIHPLYRFLTDKQTNPQFAGKINWNFNKFLIDRQGQPVARFDSSDKPESEKVIRAIEAALK